MVLPGLIPGQVSGHGVNACGAETACTMNASPHSPVESPTSLDGSISRWEGHISNGVGSTTGTDLAFLSADANELVLSGTIGTFTLPRASVIKLGRGKMYPWFFAGISFRHQEPKCPEELQFKPVGVPAREILARLRALGYPVA